MEINELVVNGDRCHCKMPTTFITTTTPIPSDEVERSLSFSLLSTGFASSSFTSDVGNNQVVGTTQGLFGSSVEALEITATTATTTAPPATTATTTAPPATTTATATAETATTDTTATNTWTQQQQSSFENRMTWTAAEATTATEEATTDDTFTELQSSVGNRMF